VNAGGWKFVGEPGMFLILFFLFHLCFGDAYNQEEKKRKYIEQSIYRFDFKENLL